MTELLVLLSIIITTSIGFVVIWKFDLLVNKYFLPNIAYSFGFGIGLIALELFEYSRISINWSVVNIILPWLVVIFILYFTKSHKKIFFKFPKSLSGIEKILLTLIALQTIFVGFESLIRPLQAWDGWASWLLKAKIFYIDGRVDESFFRYVVSEYPLIVSLYTTFIYTFIGQVNDRVALLPYFFYFTFTSVILYYSLNSQIGRKNTLIAVLLLVSLQNLVRHGGRFEAGQADLPLGYFIFASSMLIKKFIDTKKAHLLILINLFLGFTALIKNEGLAFSLIAQFIILFYLIKNKMLSNIFYSFFWFVPVIDWQIFKLVLNIEQAPYYLQDKIFITRGFVVLKEFIKEFLNIKNWNMLWVIFFSSFILRFIKYGKNIIDPLTVLLFAQIFVYFVVFLNTTLDPVLHIQNVFDRLLIHVAPLAVYLTVINIYSIRGKNMTHFNKK